MTRRILAIVPAHNEAASLPAVISALRTRRPDVDLLVIDDGSSDGTAAIAARLGAAWLHWPERRGVGAAVRAGLRYAARQGYDIVVRLDGDDQHDADDVSGLLQPLAAGTADAVFGSRFAAVDPRRHPKTVQRGLAALVSLMTRHRVTDATSGFWALGPRATRLLAEHHPDGYPEPELHLFLSRNGVRVAEVEVKWRERLYGRSSLTPLRLLAAAARVGLALVIVPLRSAVALRND